MNRLNTTSVHGIFKAVSAPLLDGESTLSGDLSASTWRNAESFTDFTCDGEQAANHTEMRVFRDRSSLYIGGICRQERLVIRERPSKDGWYAFAGDGVELMLGFGEPLPTLAMLRLSADGGRFSSGIAMENWQAAVCTHSWGWSFEIRVPFTSMQAWSYRIGFNAFREDASTAEYQQWIPTEFSSHEIDSLGEILLCSYDDAILFRTGVLPQNTASRNDYEQTVRETAIPACRLDSLPWLSNPTSNGIDVCFVTYGAAHGEIEYRRLYSEKWLKVTDDVALFHRITISGLESNTVYEYRILTKNSVYAKPFQTAAFRFRTPPCDTDAIVKACFFSDAHADVATLSRLVALPQLQDTDIVFDLGDISLQCTSGVNSIMDSGLRLYLELAKGSKIVAGVCGNHDHYGFYNRDHAKMLCGDGVKTYGSFRYGPVLFILLDSGVDIRVDEEEVIANQRLRDEQRDYLTRIKKTPQWTGTAFHVALIHITAYNDKYGSSEIMRMFDGIFDDSAENRLHALIGGHLHFYYSQLPGEDRFNLDYEWSGDSTAEVKIDTPPSSFPWLTLCIPAACGLNGDHEKASALSLSANDRLLRLDLLAVDGRTMHSFQISPDGRC